MLSQIADIWTELARENIINCFIDFISNPELLYALIQEMIYIIKLLLKEQIDLIITSFISQWNLSLKETNYHLVSIPIRNVIKEFYYDIFESKCKRNEENFNKFKEKYIQFTKSKLKGVIDNSIQDQFFEDLKSIYFKKMYLNIQRILFFIEFKNNIQIDVNDNDNRIIEPIEIKRNDCLCVEGLLNEQKNAIILLDAPKTTSGFYAFKQLKPIVVSYPKRSNSQDDFRHIDSDIIDNKLGSYFSLNSINKDRTLEGVEKQTNIITEAAFPIQKRVQLFDSLRLIQLHNNKRLSYKRINYLLIKNKSIGRSHSKTPIKGIKNYYLFKEKYSKKLRNTMIINNKNVRNSKKVNTSNQYDQRSYTCTTEINENSSNVNSKSAYVKNKETISTKLQEKIQAFSNKVINSPSSMHIKKYSELLKENLKQKHKINHRYFSNSYTHVDHISDEKISKKDIFSSKHLALQQILSPLRTTLNMRMKTFKKAEL